jgi:FkbH-like protein
VKTYIPEVLTLQVPKNLYEYPSLLRQTIDSFYNIKETDEDLIRVKTYQTESLRSELKSQFNSIDDYLKSLNLEIGFYCDRVNNIDRIAQLSQKTNQFNLTTKRYSTAEVEAFVQGSDYLTFAMDVRDRFGDFGVTACAIVKVVSSEAVIDIFLLSCRILGRNLEFKFLNEIIFYLKKLGIVTIFATYRRTAKNQQVLHFFEDAGFKIVEANETETQYILQVTEYSSKDLNYITVKK